jgi:hypothetical protein
VEDLWRAAIFQCHLHGVETELRIKAAGELQAEHIPGEQIHNRHQVEKTVMKRDAVDVVRPGLIHPDDLLEFHKAGERTD